MKSDKIIISLIIDEPTDTAEFGKRFIELLSREYTSIFPEVIGNYEPISHKISDTNEILKYWIEWPVLWKRNSKIQGEGSMWHTGNYGPGALHFVHNYAEQLDWFSLFKTFSLSMNLEFGYLHLLTKEEYDYMGNDLENRDNFFGGVFSKTIQRGIPELGWATYWGQNFIERIDHLALKGISSKFEKIKDGLLFSVTDDIFDVKKRFQEFCMKRNAIKERFNNVFHLTGNDEQEIR